MAGGLAWWAEYPVIGRVAEVSSMYGNISSLSLGMHNGCTIAKSWIELGPELADMGSMDMPPLVLVWCYFCKWKEWNKWIFKMSYGYVPHPWHTFPAKYHSSWHCPLFCLKSYTASTSVCLDDVIKLISNSKLASEGMEDSCHCRQIVGQVPTQKEPAVIPSAVLSQEQFYG